METYQLANGLSIPVLGFGTWQAKGDDAYQAVLAALKAGYRHIDTAQIYGNEAELGRAIKEAGIPRQELFITTKIWNDKHSYDLAKESIQESLAKLGTDYLDLILIHWPNPVTLRENQAWEQANRDTWRAMEEMLAEGTTRAIGVSNFMIHHLESLLVTAKVKPMVNQVLLTPGCPQTELDAFCQEHNILLEAYSPFGTGKIFSNPGMQEMAGKYGKSVAQVALRWALQHGFLPLPKSLNPVNIAANLDVFDFELSADDMIDLDQIEASAYQSNPDERDF
ncbi:aldo/keto reductase [Vaginisenegalia massiliensis]|uniref:aldo/keto reductase n=1 Tax=Vaginisenegalia massiliensis TaxID=2058294 RepID=UPI000F52CF1E|nr:aldo/keto reductase [Vaginisenegalia massiliensis]